MNTTPFLALTLAACGHTQAQQTDLATPTDNTNADLTQADDPAHDEDLSADDVEPKLPNPDYQSTDYPSQEQLEALAEAESSVAEDLERLRELDAFDVGQVIVDQSTSGHCYGMCEGEVLSFLDQAGRLADLADEADGAMKADAAPSDVTDELASLAELEIVDIGDLIVEGVSNNPYTSPDPEAEAAAEEANALRRARVAQLADAAAEL
jgi:hypothetical protein